MAKETTTRSSEIAPIVVAVVEIKEGFTTVLRLQVIGQTAIVQDCWNCPPLIGPAAAPKPHQVVKTIRQRLGGPMDVSLVFNSPSVSSLIQRAPVSTEGSIRAYVQQAILQTQKTDLSKTVWTVTPMAHPLGAQRGFTETLSNKLNVLVSMAPKGSVETVHAAFEKEGCNIVQTLFPMPALVTAFEHFVGKAFDSQVVGLLHVREGSYNLAFYRSGSLVSYAEGKTATNVVAEVRNHVIAFEGRYKLALRCIFVSSDAEDDRQLVEGLKAAGSYARTWNACRKLTFAPRLRTDVKLEQGSQFNILAGAVSAAFDAVITPPVDELDEDLDDSGETNQLLLLARPFAVAACVLIVPLVLLAYENAAMEQKLKIAEAQCKTEQKRLEQKKHSITDIYQRIADLELFSKSRRRWPQLINELRSISVAGVELLQVKASDTLSSVELNPFAPAQSTRRTHGSLVLEARNEAGLLALERFMRSVKEANQIRSVLNKKRPPRLLNNLVLGAASEEAPEKTLFTVEYLLDEKTF